MDDGDWNALWSVYRQGICPDHGHWLTPTCPDCGWSDDDWFDFLLEHV